MLNFKVYWTVIWKSYRWISYTYTIIKSWYKWVLRRLAKINVTLKTNMKTRCINRELNTSITCFRKHRSARRKWEFVGNNFLIRRKRSERTHMETILWEALRARKHHRDQLMRRQSWNKLLKNHEYRQTLVLRWCYYDLGERNERAGFLNSPGPSVFPRSNEAVNSRNTDAFNCCTCPLIKLKSSKEKL